MKKNKNSKIFIISDTHFFHNAIKEYCNRPDNYNDLIISNWKKCVSEEDIVFHLGDVIFSNASKIRDINSELSGKKILIRGNHDKKSNLWYMSHGFDFSCDAFVYEDMYFTHIPAQVLPEGCTINIHGHCHNNKRDEKYDGKIKKFQHNLHIEDNFSPILLESFLKKCK